MSPLPACDTPATRGGGLSAAQIHKQIDASLARLQTDFVDLYQCHRFDPKVPVEETMEALTEVVKAGKARYIGFSEWLPEQIEAAHALGLKHGQTLRFVVIPQALRVIIPPLTSQYLNLTKNSSLAIAIGYPDLVAIGGTIMNQKGQPVEVVVIWMVVYLGISIVTSLVMNWFNAKMALVER